MRSRILDPNAITEELGAQPSRACARGDKYLGKARDVQTGKVIDRWYTEPWGIWRLDTEGKVSSYDAAPHVLFLLNILEPKKDTIKRYLERTEEYTIRFIIFWESTGGQGGFAVPSDTLARMTELCHYVEYSFMDLDSLERDE